MAIAMASRVAVLLALAACVAAQSSTSSFVDVGAYSTLDLPTNYYAPQPIEQVMVFPSDNVGTAYWIIWHTNLTTPSWVWVGTDGVNYDTSFKGKAGRYNFNGDYVSALIHKVNVTGLSWGTQYFFRIGKNPVYYGNFTTAPAPGSPIKFAVIADLGSSNSSMLTLQHILQTGGQQILQAGDFSYADGYQPRWDLWGRMMQSIVGHLPYSFCYGNHELENWGSLYGPGNPTQGLQQFWGFYPADSRFAGPAGASSNSVQSGAVPGNQYHSTNQGAAHIISLNSYFAYGKYTLQWTWIQSDLKAVNRTATPFVIVMLHAPWYNSYYYHYLEGETMRAVFEPFFRQFLVDIVFTGHVHAYERFDNIYQYRKDPCGPVHITIGDGGNREGSSATNYRSSYPGNNLAIPSDYQLWGTRNVAQPSISLFREYSYGHGVFDIKNSSWALWTWYRNQNSTAMPSDSAWIPSHTNANNLGTYCTPASAGNITALYNLTAAQNPANYQSYPNYPAGTHPYYTVPNSDGGVNASYWYPLV